jgi:hypothetical protein
MDPDFISKALLSLGQAGLPSIILYYVARRYQGEARAERELSISQSNARITALEGAVAECDRDRKAIHERFISYLERPPKT